MERVFVVIFLCIALSHIFYRFPFFQVKGLYLFVLSYCAIIPFWFEPEVIVDTSRYFTQAKYVEIYGLRYFLSEWGNEIFAWTDTPVIPLVYGLIFKFFGESRLYIQICTTLFFSLSVIITYLIGKTLWNREIGFYAGLLLMGIPYLFTQVPLMLVDVPTMFFFTLSIFSFIQALETGGIWVLITSFSIFLAVFSKYSTWLMLSILGVIFLVYIIQNIDNPLFTKRGQCSRIKKKGEGRFVYITRGSLVLLISAFLIGIAILLKFDTISEQMKLLSSYQRPGLKRWGESFISTFLFQIHPFVTSAAIYSFYAAFKKKDLRYLIISWLIILVFILQIKRIRYIIMVFPMLALMASYGLHEIKEKEIKRFLVYSILITSLVISIFGYLPFLKKVSSINLKCAGEFIDSLKVREVEVIAFSKGVPSVNPAVSVPILDLFTKKKIYYHYEPTSFPPAEELEISPLRFTWEYQNPLYYTENNGVLEKVIVVISDNLNEPLPDYIRQKTEKYAHYRAFKTSEGIFQYKTTVTVYYNYN